MKLTLHIWRQAGPNHKGGFKTYQVDDVSEHMSFLEMMDVLNEQLTGGDQDPVAFDHDCREGICGTCSMVISGRPHGPRKGTTTCQLHMRSFKDGDSVWIEPWRAKAFPIVRDLVVDRSALDRIVQAGGYISVRAGSAPDANEIPVPEADADLAMDAATCIGCGACVAACPNASASLFTAAKISQFSLLPQGQPERYRRVTAMIETMDGEGFGSCSNHKECEAACPKDISIDFIARMNRDYMRSGCKAGSK